MNKKVLSTYDEHIKNMSKARRKKFDEGYRELLLSELLIAVMQEDEVSVRELAKAAGISPTIVQGVRSGTSQNITMQSFLKMMKALGCSLVVEKNKLRLPLELPKA
jgi:DNA-binding Xre family transcriptional regulator